VVRNGALVARTGVLARAILALALSGTVAASCGAASSAMAVESARPTPTIHYTPEPTAAPSAAAVTANPSPTATPAPNWNELPVAATDPTGLARQMTMVEKAIRDPKVSGAELAYLGHLQQLTYGQLADFPEWREPVLAALPDDIRDSVRMGLDAGKELRSMHGAIPTKLPDWKIVAPAAMEDLMSYYKEAEEAFGVQWQYLAAINLVETRMGRIRGLSSAGAQGPMQFMPPTWAMYGKGDVNDAHDAILGAARYLKAAGAPGNMQKALFAYNHAQAYVNALVDYAAVMKADPLAFRGYYGWQVYYPTPDGVILMPVGWTKPD
jgi:soluble lytic murein transglycosylase-like protein